MVDIVSALAGVGATITLLASYFLGKSQGNLATVTASFEQIVKTAIENAQKATPATTVATPTATPVETAPPTPTTATATPAAVTAQPTVDTSKPTSQLAPGKGTVLGIYGHSAYHDPPGTSATFDVNMVPEMFFDIQGTSPGNMVASIDIDGAPLKDWQEEALKVMTVGKNVAYGFWIPQKYRTVATHVVTIRLGHNELDSFGNNDSKVSHPVWDSITNYSLIFTGVKREDTD